MIKCKRALSILAFLLFVSFLVGTASAGTPHYINGTTYPMIWNGTYASENINYMTYWSTGYDMFWNGGLLQTVWDGLYAYDMIAYPNGTAISPWAMWHVESYNPTNKKWGETIPVSNQFIKIDNSTLKRVMTMGSGEKFNITYHNEGTKIKQDLELSNVLAREYRLTYRIDSVAAQDVNPNTTKFTPGFFNNFTLFDVADVIPYTVNRTFNETSGLFEGNGSYLYGWNTTASISITDRKMYFTLTNGQIMTAGQTTFIDPSWSTNGSTTPAWQNTSMDNTTIDNGTGYIIPGFYAQNWNNTNIDWVVFGSWSAVNGYLNHTEVTSAQYIYKNFTQSLSNTTPFNISFKYRNTSILTATSQAITIFTDSPSNITLFYVNSVFVRIRSTAYFLNYGSVPTAIITGNINNINDGNWHTIRISFNGVNTWSMFTDEIQEGSSGTYEPLYNSFGMRVGFTQIEQLDDVRIWRTTQGNLTAWHNSGTGNETYQIDVNATTPAGTDYIVTAYNNVTGDYLETLGTGLTGNQSLTVTSKVQDYKINVTLNGNTTATPELIQITFWTQAVSAGNQPNITSWGNNYTNNNTLLFTVPQNTNVTFNATANQTLTTCSWTGATQINCSADTYAYKLFDTAGTAYVNLSGSNANGSTLNSVNWTVTISGGEPTVYYRNTTDAITVSDTAGRKLSLFRKTADAITVSEDISRKLSATRSTEDLIAVTEGAQRVLYAFRAAADAMTVSENVNSTYIDVGEVFYRYASDAILIIEGATRQLTYIRFSEDAVIVAEGAQRTLYAFRNLADTVTVTDSAARKISLFRSAIDIITVVEGVITTYTEAGELFIRYASDTITVTESVLRSFWEGVNYYVSGYVNNILGVPLEKARVEYVKGDYAFSDATGYYNISVPSGQRDILSRAIGYRNNTETIVITNNTEQNFTLSERTAGTVTTPGFSGIAMIFISVLTLYYIKRNKKYE